ncbi:hypothetical protein AB0O07_12520 [Streptomyces sp. NPDC093085]|uniref:hypothetical protein n=1 Tax=Streptomyces sp. NPDC093085 TaxID=3155068 RepID=UPI0034200E90
MEQAEAALVERYTRLVRLAYLVLPPALGRNRRVLTAHALVQRALPRGRTAQTVPGIPGQRGTADAGRGAGRAAAREAGYAYVRARVVRQALDAGRPLLRLALPRRAQFPPLLPRVWGLRLFPRSGGADELALDQRLSALPGPARAAYVLRRLEGLTDPEVRALLAAAGTGDPADALARADATGAPGPDAGPDTGRTPPSPDPAGLLRSAEFDPCSLQARPTDLLRRRRIRGAALGTAAVLLTWGTLFGLPGWGTGPDGPEAPAYAGNPAALAALDPVKVGRIAPAAWRTAPRTDFSVWPARGRLTGDTGLLRRALAVWARPGDAVHVSATPETPTGPPMGSPHLLYAGDVDGVRVVLFHDGLRAVRYAETGGGALAALDFARTDRADEAGSGALVVGRSDDNVRYLTAPWVTGTAVRDLLTPNGAPRPLHRDGDGVTDPLQSAAVAAGTGASTGTGTGTGKETAPGACGSWDAMELTSDTAHAAHPTRTTPPATPTTPVTPVTRLVTDLGELVPARLTSGPPGSVREVSDPADRAAWARTACLLPAVRAHGVRAVNSWEYAQQPLPEKDGTAAWLCTRAETWRGPGSRVLAQFHSPAPAPASAPAALAARAADSPACGARDPRVLAGVLWKSRAGHWYLLAAGTPDLRALTTTGEVAGASKSNTLALPARAGAKAELRGETADGTTVTALH